MQQSPVYDDLQGIACAKKDKVLTITLNRPERLNTIDHGPGSLHRDIVLALERADTDEEVRCSVVTGAGRAFSAGGYLQKAGGVDAMGWYGFVSTADEENERIRAVHKPVIGAINGLCYGAAMMMVCHFDILIAVDTAEFGLIETRFGEPGVDVLAYLVGPQWAKFLSLSGELIDARMARQVGLVLDVFPPDRFMDKVYDLARRVAAMPPASAMMHRRLINASMDAAGWRNQKHIASAMNALLGSVAKQQQATDGRKFADIRAESWTTFKEARDQPFRPPWLEK